MNVVVYIIYFHFWCSFGVWKYSISSRIFCVEWVFYWDEMVWPSKSSWVASQSFFRLRFCIFHIFVLCLHVLHTSCKMEKKGKGEIWWYWTKEKLSGELFFERSWGTISSPQWRPNSCSWYRPFSSCPLVNWKKMNTLGIGSSIEEVFRKLQKSSISWNVFRFLLLYTARQELYDLFIEFHRPTPQMIVVVSLYVNLCFRHWCWKGFLATLIALKCVWTAHCRLFFHTLK